MHIYTYVNYAGNCRQAFEFYAEHLGGRIAFLTTHGENPGVQLPTPEWKDAVLHARLEIGGTAILGADVPHAEPMRSAYITLFLDGVEQAEQVYALLADGGQIFMKMEETFFAKRFAMLRDRFGTSWMLMYQVDTQ